MTKIIKRIPEEFRKNTLVEKEKKEKNEKEYQIALANGSLRWYDMRLDDLLRKYKKKLFWMVLCILLIFLLVWIVAFFITEKRSHLPGKQFVRNLFVSSVFPANPTVEDLEDHREKLLKEQEQIISYLLFDCKEGDEIYTMKTKELYQVETILDKIKHDIQEIKKRQARDNVFARMEKRAQIYNVPIPNDMELSLGSAQVMQKIKGD